MCLLYKQMNGLLMVRVKLLDWVRSSVMSLLDVIKARYIHFCLGFRSTVLQRVRELRYWLGNGLVIYSGLREWLEFDSRVISFINLKQLLSGFCVHISIQVAYVMLVPIVKIHMALKSTANVTMNVEHQKYHIHT